MRSIFIALCALLYLSSQLQAKIISYSSLDELFPTFEQATSDTLVVFDIDDTLVTKKDKILRPASSSSLMYYYFRLLQRCSFDKIMHLLSIIQKNAQGELVDERWPTLISLLQNRTPYVMGHSETPPGKVGILESFPAFKQQSLSEFKIDFSNITTVGWNNFQLKELNHIPDVIPAFYAGILFSDNYSKGEALSIFLKHLKFTPKLVIFVDDQISHVKSVDKEMTKRKIPVLAIHFKEANLFNETVSAQDKKIAEAQYHHLIKHEMWLSDQQAILQLN